MDGTTIVLHGNYFSSFLYCLVGETTKMWGMKKVRSLKLRGCFAAMHRAQGVGRKEKHQGVNLSTQDPAGGQEW